MGIATELIKLFPSEPPSKEFIEKLAELNKLSGNKILGPLEDGWLQRLNE